MISRRRFLSISAAAVAMPASAQPLRWQGHALGAEASLVLHAQPELAAGLLADVQALLRRAEALFSLYDPTSQLSVLNRTGKLSNPAPELLDLLGCAGQVHAATGGAFDPTVQPLWQAYARQRNIKAARKLVDWSRVRIAPDSVRIGQGQALTLNGIAQGYATDMVANKLRQAGLTRVLVNIGEFAGVGGPWHLGISDPAHGLVASRRLTDRAIATSSPSALSLSHGRMHIFGPKGQRPLWSTVSVEADNATVADAASTAFCLLSEKQIKQSIAELPGYLTATLVEFTGTVRFLA